MRTSTLFASAALAIVLALGAVACGSDTTGVGGATTTPTSTFTGSGGATPCGALAWSSTNPTCNGCMEESCCGALAACDAGSPCAALVDCLRACAPGDASCVSACETANADGQGDLDALIGCFEASCKQSPACGAKVCDAGVSVPNQQCGECLSAACCDTWKLCAQEETCLDCLVTGAASCQGHPLYLAALQCQVSNCDSKCAARICDTNLGYPDKPACNHCLGQIDANGGCCEVTRVCADDKACLDCITGKTTTGCEANAAYEGFTTCQMKCADECAG